jgi:hypothetical protein
MVSYNPSDIESSEQDSHPTSASSPGWNEVQQTVWNEIYPPSESETPIPGATDLVAQTDMGKAGGIIVVGVCVAMLFLALSICES